MNEEVKLTEEQNKKLLEIANDFYRYCENNLWIKDKDTNIVPFVPNRAQRALIDRVLDLIEKDELIRMIVLKARQMGLSTAIEALIYWWTSTHQNVTSSIIAHQEDASRNLYNMFKRYYDNSNILFKPSRKYDTRSDIKFAKEDDDGNQIGLNSVIKTATAKNTGTGRSDTIQLVHGSEVAFWDNGEELVASLMQTVPRRPKTMIFLESTANGRGNFFAKQWDLAAKGDNDYETFFFPWWIQDEYEDYSGDPIDEYTEEEKEIIQLMKDGIQVGAEYYTVPEEKIEPKIRFRRYKEREFRATPEKLYQEYPSTPYEAFISSGKTVFNTRALATMEKHVKEAKTYVIEDNELRNPVVKEDSFGKLKIWDMPKALESYVIGADVAEGLADGDYSVADVVRMSDMKTVARYRAQVDPDQFAHILDKLGRFYNYALLGPEVNNHGLAVIQRLRDLFYTNLYKRETGLDEVFETPTAKFGWKTTAITKPLAIDYLTEAIRDGLVIDEDIVFIQEAFSYVRDDRGRTNAEVGTHDDTVMAKAIALQLFEWSANNKDDLKFVKPSKKSNRKRVIQ